MIDYISEFKNPTIRSSEEKFFNALDLDRYDNYLEQLRQQYIDYVSRHNEKYLQACLEELRETGESIKQRGYYALDEYNINTLIQNNIPDGQQLLLLKRLDCILQSSLSRTVRFIEQFLASTTKSDPPKENVSASIKPQVLKGTNQLADYLGCCHATAFKIIKSRVLDNRTQYRTGKIWTFNIAKLDEALKNNPELLKYINK